MVTAVKYTFEDHVSDSLTKIDKRLAGLDKHFNATEAHMNKMGSGSKGLGDAISRFNIAGGKTEAILQGLTDQVPALGNVMDAVRNPWLAAGTAVIGVGVALDKAVDYANLWEHTMAKVNVTAQLSRGELDKLGERIRQVSMSYATDLQAVPDAFNQIISGVGDVDKSMDILDKSLKAADAGFTDVKTAADAAVNVMNSVGNTTAQETFDVLFATLNKGKAEFADIANYLPKVIPYSNQLGLSFKETSAAFALMTAKGQTAEQTTMLLQNAFKSLSDKDKRSNLEKVVKVFDHGKVRPFVDIIGDLSKKYAGLTNQEERIKAMGKLGLDSEAASAFSILLQNADEFKKFNDVVQSSSTGVGALNKAFQDSENSTRNTATAMNMLKGAWLWIGQQAKPIWDAVIGKVVDFFRWIKTVEDRFHIFSAAFHLAGTTLKVIWDALSLPFRAIWHAMKEMYGYADALFQKLNGGGEKSVSLFTKLATKFSDVLSLARAVGDAIGHLLSGNISALKDDWGTIVDRATTYGNVASSAPQATAQSLYGGYKDLLSPEGQKKAEALMAGGGKTAMPPAKTSTATAASWGGKDAKEHQGVAGGGSQVRNVYVTIQKMVGAETLHTTNIAGDRNLLRELEELMVRASRDAEITLSNN